MQKQDPTIINGGVLNSIGSSAKLGVHWSLVESDGLMEVFQIHLTQ